MSVESVGAVGERYVVLSRIGSGGMADVYLARDSLLDRNVALKVLRARGAGAQDKDRFVDEGRILARLSHPNLVTLLDVGIAEEPYLVMEYVDGPTLADRPGPTDLDTVALWGGQLADALSCAHGAGVVHRDVKPGNILLGPDGRTRLTDFGIARLLEEGAHHTAEGLAVGTAAYLAPEQVSSEPVGPAADVYSLGLVLLEAITGVRAYPGPPIEAAVARLTTPPSIPDDVPPDWQRLLRRMTALDAGHRPDAAEVASALRALEPRPAVVVHPAPSLDVPDVPDVPDASVGAHALRIAAVAAVAVIVVCGYLLARAGQGVPPVEPELPEVAASVPAVTPAAETRRSAEREQAGPRGGHERAKAEGPSKGHDKPQKNKGKGKGKKR